MIDHLLTFETEPAAQADPIIGQYWNADASSWDLSQCIPNVQVTVIATGQPYDANWRINIAKPSIDPALQSHPAISLIADRDGAAAGQPPSEFIKFSVVDATEWPLLSVSPQFQGADYPFGE